MQNELFRADALMRRTMMRARARNTIQRGERKREREEESGWVVLEMKSFSYRLAFASTFPPFSTFSSAVQPPSPPYETGELHVQLKELLVNSRRYTSLIIITKSNHVGNSFGCTVTESIMENIKIVNKI